MIAAKYLNRNPDLLVADASDYISDHGDACEVYPITINPENQLLTDRGVITSACGITWYNGGLFPDSFNNVTFVAEPVSNIIHADRITERGATFTASRNSSSAANEALNRSAAPTANCSADNSAPSNRRVNSSNAASPRSWTSFKIPRVRSSIVGSNKLEAAASFERRSAKSGSVCRSKFIRGR